MIPSELVSADCKDGAGYIRTQAFAPFPTAEIKLYPTH